MKTLVQSWIQKRSICRSGVSFLEVDICLDDHFFPPFDVYKRTTHFLKLIK